MHLETAVNRLPPDNTGRAVRGGHDELGTLSEDLSDQMSQQRHNLRLPRPALPVQQEGHLLQGRWILSSIQRRVVRDNSLDLAKDQSNHSLLLLNEFYRIFRPGCPLTQQPVRDVTRPRRRGLLGNLRGSRRASRNEHARRHTGNATTNVVLNGDSLRALVAIRELLLLLRLALLEASLIHAAEPDSGEGERPSHTLDTIIDITHWLVILCIPFQERLLVRQGRG